MPSAAEHGACVHLGDRTPAAVMVPCPGGRLKRIALYECLCPATMRGDDTARCVVTYVPGMASGLGRRPILQCAREAGDVACPHYEPG